MRWGTLSALSFLSSVGLTVALTELVGLAPRVSFGITQGVVFVLNFVGLRHFVFQRENGSLMAQLGWFGAFSALFRGTEWLVFYLIDRLQATDYRVLVICVLAASSAVKFLVYNRVFAKRRHSPAPREAVEARPIS